MCQYTGFVEIVERVTLRPWPGFEAELVGIGAVLMSTTPFTQVLGRGSIIIAHSKNKGETRDLKHKVFFKGHGVPNDLSPVLYECPQR